MKVANRKFDMSDATMDRVYAAQRLEDAGTEHDARGLLVAIALSAACWAVLGYFVLQ